MVFFATPWLWVRTRLFGFIWRSASQISWCRMFAKHFVFTHSVIESVASHFLRWGDILLLTNRGAGDCANVGTQSTFSGINKHTEPIMLLVRSFFPTWLDRNFQSLMLDSVIVKQEAYCCHGFICSLCHGGCVFTRVCLLVCKQDYTNTT